MSAECDGAEALMRRCLDEVRSDFDRPDARLAWFAFRRFAAQPIPGLTATTVGYHILQRDDRDDILWLGFMRRFDASQFGWSCGCLFRVTAPLEMMGVDESHW